MSRKQRIPAWKICRDGLAFRAAFLAAGLDSADGRTTADEAITRAERDGRRLGSGRHIGPQVADLHRRDLTAPVETPDGFRAAIVSRRHARRNGLSGVWQVADRSGCEAELIRILALLRTYPTDTPTTTRQRGLFDND